MSASFGNRHLLIFVSYFLGFQLMYSGALLRESTAAHPEHAAKRSLLLCCAAGIFNNSLAQHCFVKHETFRNYQGFHVSRDVS
jgi:hypothetical protein